MIVPEFYKNMGPRSGTFSLHRILLHRLHGQLYNDRY